MVMDDHFRIPHRHVDNTSGSLAVYKVGLAAQIGHEQVFRFKLIVR